MRITWGIALLFIAIGRMGRKLPTDQAIRLPDLKV
jgi:hypothetical protein